MTNCSTSSDCGQEGPMIPSPPQPEDKMFIFALVILLSILWTVLTRSVVTKQGTLRMPPSPPGRLPILGHLWQFHPTKPFETIDRWSKKFGDVMTVFFGTTPVIVISRHRLLREAFLRDGENFSGRPSLFVHESCWGKGHVISDGPRNAVLRKHLLGILRNKSRGLGTIQELVTGEIKKMFTYVEQQMTNNTTDIVLEDTIFYVVGNVLTQIVMGKCHPHGSKEFSDSARWLGDTMELMEKTAPLTFLPWLRFLPGGLGYHKMKKQAASVQKMMLDDVRLRRSTKEYEDLSKTDFASQFIRLMDTFAGKDEHADIYSEEMLAKIMTEMFFAGIQTECNTFGWAFLYFLFYPEEQKACRNEILQTLNPEEDIVWADRERLPYLEATIAEVQRLANIAPFSMPHRNQHETVLDGYRIPANSMIFMNLYSTLADPDIFPDPFTFKPSRFIENGRVNRQLMALSIPYGIGPRMCMGESIARCELFSVIGSLLRRYEFTGVPGEKYSLEQKMELTIHPDKYTIRLTKI